MNKSIITINKGSSNIKLGIFDVATLQLLGSTKTNTIEETLNWLKPSENIIAGISHRVVHGGKKYISPVTITDAVLEELHLLIPLAPLHQPASLEIIKILGELYTDILQVACFDTAFHHSHSNLETRIPLPKEYDNEAIQRYGFHGLSYQYIASILPEYARDKSYDRVIVVHLGSGASMCAMHKLKSVASTMGFSTLEGLMMDTRCGSIDPGIILYLLQQKHMSSEQVSDLLYNNSGLKGVSGISDDMRVLVESTDKNAKDAIELYCYLASKQLGALLMTLGGMDGLVFTGGIGEHSPFIRQKICNYLVWLGVKIDEQANYNNATIINTINSTTTVYVIPTNEEKIMAKACQIIIGQNH